MEKEQKGISGFYVIFSLLSFLSAILSIFTMYLIFTAVAVVTGVMGLQEPNTKGLSIASLSIVLLLGIVKLVMLITTSGLPVWLTSGLL
ncbi:MAG: hypothetical protein PHR25_06510 [Clostridia bacterium]|nr:hypothetical protein [Clostridia bacterium]MDD4376406.1 hypothetical protein [Clostridia bacterium]